MRNYLIEGVSGSGKTTVAEHLQERGFHVIHGDRTLAFTGDPKTGLALGEPPAGTAAEQLHWRHAHWIWPVDTVRALIADRSHPVSFLCGGSRNHDQFIDLFDAVFVLEVDVDTLNERLDRRPQDEFGALPIERALVLRVHASGEDTPTGIAIDATAPVAKVVDQILLICESSTTRDG